MKLTVGMAHFEDYHGAWFTIANILADNLWQDPSEIEIIVVDNSPEHSKHATELQRFCAQHVSGGENVRYIRHDGPPSTTQPRQAVFDNATGDIVCVVDCHIKTSAFALNRLVQYFVDNPESRDIVSGPLVYNWASRSLNDDVLPSTGNQSVFESHFDPKWRSEMYGIWARDMRAVDREAAPFEVPGQGLGLFACHKDAWLGFNPNFLGFGGEELYIHQKFRNAGARALCLPFLRWIHRFGRPDGVPYPLSRWNKVRNYVLGHQELGLDVSEIYDHFINLRPDFTDDELRTHLVVEHSLSSKDLANIGRDNLNKIHARFKMLKDDWDYLIESPIEHIAPMNKVSFSSFGFELPPAIFDVTGKKWTANDLYDWLLGHARRDLHPHLEAMRLVGDKCRSITEFTKRRESTVVWAASSAETIRSYTTEPDTLVSQALSLVPPGRIQMRLGLSSDEISKIEPTDLLYLNTVHSATRLHSELDKYLPSVDRYVLLTGAQEYGAYAQGTERMNPRPHGMWAPIKTLLDAGEWFVVWHREASNGMTLLGKLAGDRPTYVQHIWPPPYGVGSELKKLLAGIGILEKPGCPCNAFAAKMDRWGLDGCIVRREQIIGQLRTNAKGWGWGKVSELLKPANAAGLVVAAWKSIKSGLIFNINPADPFGGLVDEAIKAERAAFELRTGAAFDDSKLQVPAELDTTD